MTTTPTTRRRWSPFELSLLLASPLLLCVGLGTLLNGDDDPVRWSIQQAFAISALVMGGATLIIVAAKRGWSFSVRMLVVAVTLLAVPLGGAAWELQTARIRRATKQWVEARGGKLYGDYVQVIAEEGRPVSEFADANDRSGEFMRKHRPSWVRQIMDDDVIVRVRLPQNVTPDELRQVRRAFPEAELYTWDPATSVYTPSAQN